jgi:hypothetical protein
LNAPQPPSTPSQSEQLFAWRVRAAGIRDRFLILTESHEGSSLSEVRLFLSRAINGLAGREDAVKVRELVMNLIDSPKLIGLGSQATMSAVNLLRDVAALLPAANAPWHPLPSDRRADALRISDPAAEGAAEAAEAAQASEGIGASGLDRLLGAALDIMGLIKKATPVETGSLRMEEALAVLTSGMLSGSEKLKAYQTAGQFKEFYSGPPGVPAPAECSDVSAFKSAARGLLKLGLRALAEPEAGAFSLEDLVAESRAPYDVRIVPLSETVTPPACGRQL